MPPKSAASRRVIALDSETVRLLRRYEQAQRRHLGDAWLESGPIFARPDGSPLRPDYLSVRFREWVHASGLPPIRYTTCAMAPQVLPWPQGRICGWCRARSGTAASS
ncbi:hypothetical protein GCM10023074_42210 [Microbispora amethystogenes]|uniref:Uncharacterized protein n=1 Tax=Microbispora amethystogenes TaxID=1427754 RepID=A0ABQ4FDJ5_9ACTN|nr:hypothetical protein Mam01_30640 [Microbispora amethystogenes]